MIEYWFYQISWMKINFNQLAKKKKYQITKHLIEDIFSKLCFHHEYNLLYC